MSSDKPRCTHCRQAVELRWVHSHNDRRCFDLAGIAAAQALPAATGEPLANSVANRAETSSSPVQRPPEPIAWLYDWITDGEVVRDWITSDASTLHDPATGCHNIRPLYTAPAPAQAEPPCVSKTPDERRPDFGCDKAECSVLGECASRMAPAPAQAEPPEGLPFGIIDPDYARVFTQARIVAWQYGYACVMHGSFTRDLDLLLVPWAAHAFGNHDQLVRLIAAACDLKVPVDTNKVIQWGTKPHGRVACTLHFPGFNDRRWVDISIMPCIKAGTSGEQG